MKAAKFNQLSIREKGIWIVKQLRGQKYGIANTMMFKDKHIFFQLQMITGQVVKAEAYEWDNDLHKQGIAMLLGEKICYNMILDNMPAFNHAIEGAIKNFIKQQNTEDGRSFENID